GEAHGSVPRWPGPVARPPSCGAGDPRPGHQRRASSWPVEGRDMFDQYIPLGMDCEVVVQLRRLTGCSQAHVFDWHVSRHESLMHVLRTDFADYLQLPNLEVSPDAHHVLDTATGLELHHLFRVKADGTVLPHRVAPDFPQVRERADHLLRRWRATVGS